MPFPPELQDRIDTAKAAIAGVAPDDSELGRLKAKLAARDGKPGFKANCADLRARISELSGDSQENDNG
jgi:hypothetical protein